jgi:DNA repair protein RecO (recombination protein O)
VTNIPPPYNSSFRPGQECQTLAIILRVLPFRESDLIAHALTPDFGKLSLIARHARGSKRRFPAALDLFDRGTATLAADKNGSMTFKGFTPVHSLTKVRSNLDKLTLASLLSEAYDLVIPEHDMQSCRQLFEVLDLSLNAVDEAPDLATALRATYIAIVNLGSIAGFIDLSDVPPSSHNLERALNAIEQFAQRSLATRNPLRGVIKKMGRSA